MQLQHFLENSARSMPEKVALVMGERRLSYSQIDNQCNRFARKLAAGGVNRWDRVVIWMENSIETVVAIFATLKLGATFVVVNPTTKAEKLTYILNDSGAAALVTDDEKLASVADNGVEALVRVTVLQRDVLDCKLHEGEGGSFPPPPEVGVDMDLAALVYTSGSTGKPKGVMLTHLNMVSAATSITTYLENTSDDVVLNVLPLSFDYGLYQVIMAFKAGATLVLEKSFTYPAAVLNRVAKERVTGFPIVPTISAILLQMNLSQWDLSSLRYISNTGAALPGNHITRLRQTFPHVKIFSMYGLTECKRVSYLPPDQIDIRPGSVGRGMPNEDVYIVDDVGDPVGPNVVGELVIRGSNVMKGYWRMSEETDRVLKPGRFPWERVLHSGDLFRSDEEGYLYFIGRKDDIIKTRGEKVSPKEVEEVLYSAPGVAEAAVVAVPDPVLGSAIKAIVVPAQGRSLSEKDILHYCSQHLDDFAVPKSVEFRETLPRTSSGKIAKRELVEQVQAAS
jgi:amino acid adenylation domain-containing protein